MHIFKSIFQEISKKGTHVGGDTCSPKMSISCCCD